MSTAPDAPPIGNCTGCGMASVLNEDDYCGECQRRFQGYDEGQQEQALEFLEFACRMALQAGCAKDALVAMVERQRPPMEPA